MGQGVIIGIILGVCALLGAEIFTFINRKSLDNFGDILMCKILGAVMGLIVGLVPCGLYELYTNNPSEFIQGMKINGLVILGIIIWLMLNVMMVKKSNPDWKWKG